MCEGERLPRTQAGEIRPPQTPLGKAAEFGTVALLVILIACNRDFHSKP